MNLLATFQFYEDNANEWRWRIRGRNSEITAANGQVTHASSEGFASKRSAINNLTLVEETVRAWAPHN